MSNGLNAIPGVSAGISLVAGLINKIERGVNSSEHNFKKDLHSILKPMLGDKVADKIKSFLDTGKDQGLGDRLRALMSSGLIPPSLAPQIAQLASQNGVPQSSIDRNALHRPMDAFEGAQTLGKDHATELGASDFFHNAVAHHDKRHQMHQEKRKKNLFPN